MFGLASCVVKDFSKADFLVTGDKDLLELTPFLTAQIVSTAQFASNISA